MVMHLANLFVIFEMNLLFFIWILLVGLKSAYSQQNFFDNIQTRIFDVFRSTITGAQEIVGIPPTLNDVAFYLYSRTESNKRIDPLNPEGAVNLNGTTVILVHGYYSSRFNPGFPEITSILTNKPNTIVIQVDWALPALDSYPAATFSTESVGGFIGDMVNRLVTNHRVSLRSFILIGHSLGAHVVGWAGKRVNFLLNQQLPRIIALDPAGPLFITRPSSRKLNPSDAEVVQVIHTDGENFGLITPSGTIDFFPNGGKNQPGCLNVNLVRLDSLAEAVFCDHVRSLLYFAEAINVTGSFPAQQCGSYEDFLANSCSNNQVVNMGNLNLNATGIYFLRTNAQSPFSRNLEWNEPSPNFFGFTFNLGSL